MMIPETFRPSNITWENGIISYDYIDGAQSQCVATVWEHAKEALWEGKPQEIDRKAYIDYVKMRCENFPYIPMPDVELTPVRMTHGDLTMSNTIGNCKFIDCGDSRGLECREIDEAKLLQSLDGFDVWKRNHLPAIGPAPFKIRKIHLWLLWTHYIRMWRHQPNPFAFKRIEELCNILS